MPEANTRLAALRSGQVDWIEVPPPDAIPSLKRAGFAIVDQLLSAYLAVALENRRDHSPFKDVRVRQGLNYCVDRAGLVPLLNGTAEPPSAGSSHRPGFGKPEQPLRVRSGQGQGAAGRGRLHGHKPCRQGDDLDPGSGQMLPLAMNEYLQENLKQACGVEVEFDVVEWQVLLTAIRQSPDAPILRGSLAVNVRPRLRPIPGSWRATSRRPFSPNGFNWDQWNDPAFEGARRAARSRTKAFNAAYPKAHERLVDNPPWLYIVHDLNPRAMSKRVKGFVSAQSWFQDLVTVDLQ